MLLSTSALLCCFTLHATPCDIKPLNTGKHFVSCCSGASQLSESSFKKWKEWVAWVTLSDVLAEFWHGARSPDNDRKLVQEGGGLIGKDLPPRCFECGTLQWPFVFEGINCENKVSEQAARTRTTAWLCRKHNSTLMMCSLIIGYTLLSTFIIVSDFFVPLTFNLCICV